MSDFRKPRLPCRPYKNNYYCSPQKGITVTQPEVQTIPNGDIVNNPYYNSKEKASYWTYKLITNCDLKTKKIKSFVIPICETLSKEIITVEEKIDGFSDYIPIEFELSNVDSDFGKAPEGYKFLRIENNNNFDIGVSVLYRIKVLGNYTVALKSIQVKTEESLLTFNQYPKIHYQVPSFPKEEKLVIIKDCEQIIRNNKVELSYEVGIINIGRSTLNNLRYKETIMYDAGSINIEEINAKPATLKVVTTTPRIIFVSGVLGALHPGKMKWITINIKVDEVKKPGQYSIKNVTLARSGVEEACSPCLLSFEAVQLKGEKYCFKREGNIAGFKTKISSAEDSPTTKVNITEQIIIPKDVIVQFIDFDGYTAIFADTGEIVPLRSNISNRKVIITCDSIIIPEGGAVIGEIKFELISTRAFIEAKAITSTLIKVEILHKERQLLLGGDSLSITAQMNIKGKIKCLGL